MSNQSALSGITKVYVHGHSKHLQWTVIPGRRKQAYLGTAQEKSCGQKYSKYCVWDAELGHYSAYANEGSSETHLHGPRGKENPAQRVLREQK